MVHETTATANYYSAWLSFTDASYRFYRSKCEEASINKRGLLAEKQKTRRRHERLARVCLTPYRMAHVAIYTTRSHASQASYSYIYIATQIQLYIAIFLHASITFFHRN